MRAQLGNRVNGCDDCMAVCPWNRFARSCAESDFAPRHGLEHADLLELFAWDQETFLHRTTGSAIRRIGYQRWQRNLAVALGNGVADEETVAALRARLGDAPPLLREHIAWALQRLLKEC